MNSNASNDKSWFAKGTAYNRVTQHILTGSKVVRIATGYFSVEGWNLIRKFYLSLLKLAIAAYS